MASHFTEEDFIDNNYLNDDELINSVLQQSMHSEEFNSNNQLNTNNELDFWRLNFEYIECEGITLYPWLNQFPEPVFPKKIRPLGMKGLGYDIPLLDNNVDN